MAEETGTKPKRRRSRGLGSIRKIAEGKFRIAYDLPRVDSDKTRRQRYEISFGPKRKAEELLQMRLAAIRVGGIPDEDRLTFNSLADRYLDAKAISKEPTTVALYRRILSHHARPAMGNLRLSDIRSHHISDVVFKAKSTRRGHDTEDLSSTTQRNLLTMLRSVLAWGVRQGYLLKNVADGIEGPRERHVERMIIGVQGVRALLEAAAGTELEGIVAVAIGTGLRRAELCALRWSDIDLDRPTIAVSRAAANLDGKVVIKAPKTKRSKRVDSLPVFVVEALRRHKLEQAKRNLALGARLGQDALVFDRADGSMWDPNEVSRQFAKIIRQHRLPAMRFHDLRHAYASLSFAAGVSMAVVSRSLGHSSVGITDAVYVHLRDDAREDKAAKLDAHLEEAVGPRKRLKPGGLETA